jgi:hypothetical protein
LLKSPKIKKFEDDVAIKKKRKKSNLLKKYANPENDKGEMNLIMTAEKFKKLPATAHLLRMVRNPKNIVVLQ